MSETLANLRIVEVGSVTAVSLTNNRSISILGSAFTFMIASEFLMVAAIMRSDRIFLVWADTFVITSKSWFFTAVVWIERVSCLIPALTFLTIGKFVVLTASASVEVLEAHTKTMV